MTPDGGDEDSTEAEIVQVPFEEDVDEDGDDALGDDEWVTQTGHLKYRAGPVWHRCEFSFRSALRQQMNEDYMSVILGRLSPIEAVPMVSRGDYAGSADGVRHAQISSLREKGFRVERLPSKLIPGHLGVFWDPGEWTADVAMAFSSCFTLCMQGPIQ